jgi:hypothetical protein
MNYSRRHFARTAAAGLPLSRTLAKTINSKVAGVQRSAQWCSFRDLGVDDAINAMVADGLDDCELFSPHIEAGGVQALARACIQPRKSKPGPLKHMATESANSAYLVTTLT